jgi:hypothetical protein
MEVFWISDVRPEGSSVGRHREPVSRVSSSGVGLDSHAASLQEEVAGEINGLFT